MILLDADIRSMLGKKTRALRRQGIIPIHVYGFSMPSITLQATEEAVIKTLRSSGKTSIVKININGGKESETCLVRDMDVHPVTGKILHVDFIRVAEDKKVEVEVPVKLVNQQASPLIRTGRVNIMLVLPKVKISALPQDIPTSLDIDCSQLTKMTDTVTTGELKLPPGGELVRNPDLRVISLQITRAARASQG